MEDLNKLWQARYDVVVETIHKAGSDLSIELVRRTVQKHVKSKRSLAQLSAFVPKLETTLVEGGVSPGRALSAISLELIECGSDEIKPISCADCGDGKLLRRLNEEGLAICGSSHLSVGSGP